MRLNTLQCKGQTPTTKDTKDYPAPNVHSAEAEKCWSVPQSLLPRWLRIPTSWLGPCLPALWPSLFSQSYPHKTLTGSEHTALNSPKRAITFRIIFKILTYPGWPLATALSLLSTSLALLPSSLLPASLVFLPFFQTLTLPGAGLKVSLQFSPASSLASLSSIFKQPLIREAFDDHPLLKFLPSPPRPSLSSCCIFLRSTYHYLMDYKSVLYSFTIYLPHWTVGTLSSLVSTIFPPPQTILAHRRYSINISWVTKYIKWLANRCINNCS